MNKKDIVAGLLLLLLFLPFFISDALYSFYERINSNHGFITSFVKFAVLATYGEVVGLRIRTGEYRLNGFGLVPRMIVWGFLGISIKAAFIIFSAGAPAILATLGMRDAPEYLAGPFGAAKLLVAFSVSVTLNFIFAPVLMTVHRITDMHILMNGGSWRCLFQKIEVRAVIESIDWKMHWGFVIKKTIPFFWVPAQTVTFLLPVDFQILFAALLGVILGIILASASAGRT